jgi:hypothetical protein
MPTADGSPLAPGSSDSSDTSMESPSSDAVAMPSEAQPVPDDGDAGGTMTPSDDSTTIPEVMGLAADEGSGGGWGGAGVVAVVAALGIGYLLLPPAPRPRRSPRRRA